MDRRQFVKYLAGGSALSVYSLNKLNAAVYESIAGLNQQFQDFSPDGIYWEAVRKHFLFEDNLIMMNNGTLGPMPEPVYNTLIKYFKIQCTNPYRCYSFFSTLKGEVRNKLARFIGADPDEVALTRNTTAGMNVGANGIDMQPGDEVLMTDLEHPGGLQPWRLKAKRYHINIKEVHLDVPPKSTAEIIADSAHGVGMLDLNMHRMGVDLFCSSPYKWCGAPTGVGVLYVRKEAQDRIWPQIASSGWDRTGASKYETLGQGADPLIFAFGEAMDFQNIIGRDRIERRIKTLAARLKEELHKLPKVRVHTPDDPYLSGGLTAFSIEGVSPNTIVNYVREKYNIVIRTIGSSPQTRGVRVSTNIYISDRQLDMLIEGIKHLAQ